MNRHDFTWDKYMKDNLIQQNELHRINDKITRLVEHAKRVKAYDPKTNDERAQKGMLIVKIVMMTKPYVQEWNKVSKRIFRPGGVKTGKNSDEVIISKPNKS